MTHEDRADFQDLERSLGITDEMTRQVRNFHADRPIPYPDGVPVAVKPSSIEGMGIFATRHIPAGEVFAPARIADRLTPSGRFTNHVRYPNSEFVPSADSNLYHRALRDIERDEEITVNYRHGWRISYASAVGLPFEQVTLEMACNAIRAALRAKAQ